MKMNSKTILKIIFSLMILAFLATRMDWTELQDLIKTVQLVWWLPASILMLLQIFMTAWRWHVMINGEGNKITYQTALRMTLAGNLANIVIVASIGGILARIALVVHHGMSLTRATAAAIIDRLITLGTLGFLSALFVPFLPMPVSPTIIMTSEAGIFLGVLLLAGLPWILKWLRTLFTNNTIVIEIIHYLGEIFSAPSRLIQIIAASLLSQTAYFIAIIFIALAAAPEINSLSLIALLPLIVLVASLPISFGGWGVREGSFIFGLGLLGVAPETAFIISVQIGLLSMLITVLAGIPAIMHQDIYSLLKLKKKTC